MCPTYNYECKACGSTESSFEQSMTPAPSVKLWCSACGKQELIRLIGTGGGIIFKKGSGGFYSKDYPKNNEKGS